MRISLVVSVVVGVVAMGALSGCSVNASANLTVPGSDIADSAAGALEEQIGIRPEMDCGDEQVDLVDGTVVDCVLTDPSTESTFDAPVTISDVDGTEYKVSVEVADTPAGSSVPRAYVPRVVRLIGEAVS